MSAPHYCYTPHSLHLENNNARIASPVEPRSIPHRQTPRFFPLSNGQSGISTFPFLPSRRIKHEHRLHLDLAPAVAPSTQHTRFTFFFLFYSHSFIAYLYLSHQFHHINTLRPALLKGTRQLEPSFPSLVCNFPFLSFVWLTPKWRHSLSAPDVPQPRIPAGSRAINNRPSSSLTRSIARPHLRARP